MDVQSAIDGIGNVRVLLSTAKEYCMMRRIHDALGCIHSSQEMLSDLDMYLSGDDALGCKPDAAEKDYRYP